MRTELHYILNERRYRAASGETLGRENGVTPNGNPMNGQWVYRNAAGEMVDFNQYRNDLESRHHLTLHGGE